MPPATGSHRQPQAATLKLYTGRAKKNNTHVPTRACLIVQEAAAVLLICDICNRAPWRRNDHGEDSLLYTASFAAADPTWTGLPRQPFLPKACILANDEPQTLVI